MKKIYTFILLAVFGLSINIHLQAQITGEYTGTAKAKCTLLSIDETIDNVVVTIKDSSPGYCLEVAEIDMGDGVVFPAYEVCGITATPNGANYTLTAAPVNIVIPEITIPPTPPYFPQGATFTNVPAVIKLTNGIVTDSTLTLKIEITATVQVGPLPVPIPLTIDYFGAKKVIEAPFEGEGTADSPYLIYNELDLQKMSDLVNDSETNHEYRDKYYKVMKDIDLTMFASNGWYPIGFCREFPFTGHFNGNNKKITNMKLMGHYLFDGLFGCLMSGGTISNLEIENAEIDNNCECPDDGEIYIGIIVGYVDDPENGKTCTITNCNTSGTINCSVGQKHAFVGGIAGLLLNNCTISNCYSTASVTCTSEQPIYVGGIVGATIKNSVTVRCYSKGDVRGTTNTSAHVGGIAGIVGWGYSNLFPKGDNCAVSDCYTTGKVVSSALSSSGIASAGGVVGAIVTPSSSLICTLSNSYSTSEVKCYAWMVHAGGVAGVNTGSSISNCAALNPSIICAAYGMSEFGRITGKLWDAFLINNIAFSDMMNPDSTTIWLNKGLDKKDGEDFTSKQIVADGSLGGRFTEGKGGWTIQNGFLPGLFGQVEEIPEFLEPSGIASAALNNTITVYPNPTTGKLSIVNCQLSIKSVDVFDVLGKKHESTKTQIHEAGWILDISGLSNGVYFLKNTTEKGVVTKKVIKN